MVDNVRPSSRGCLLVLGDVRISLRHRMLYVSIAYNKLYYVILAKDIRHLRTIYVHAKTADVNVPYRLTLTDVTAISGDISRLFPANPPFF